MILRYFYKIKFSKYEHKQKIYFLVNPKYAKNKKNKLFIERAAQHSCSSSWRWKSFLTFFFHSWRGRPTLPGGPRPCARLATDINVTCAFAALLALFTHLPWLDVSYKIFFFLYSSCLTCTRCFVLSVFYPHSMRLSAMACGMLCVFLMCWFMELLLVKIRSQNWHGNFLP